MRTRFASLHFVQNRRREDLTQLHTPLVKAVHIPDDPLNKCLVFIERNQVTQRAGRELVQRQRCGRAIAGKCLLRRELVEVGTV